MDTMLKELLKQEKKTQVMNVSFMILTRSISCIRRYTHTHVSIVDTVHYTLYSI